MPGTERVGLRIKVTYDDLCALGDPWVCDIVRTWSERWVWPVAQQLINLGLAQASTQNIYVNTRLKMLPWQKKKFANAQDVSYMLTTVLTQSHGPRSMLHTRNLLGGQRLRNEAKELNKVLVEQREARARKSRRYQHRKE